MLNAFRTGDGVPYADYGPDLHEGQARFTRPMFDSLLASEWLKAVPEVHERLLADPPARVADVACGEGRSTLAIARDRALLLGATLEVVRTNGLEVAYERVGEGPPLLLVHGAAADGRLWQPQLAALSDEFTVVAWDEPGAGRSSDVPGDFGLVDYANCRAALIEALALGPAHVAGLSWGGTVVQELYRHHRELVATLIRKLREADRMLAEGKAVGEVCRHLEVSEPTYHRWRTQFGGMKADDVKRLKELERENARLKRIVADQALNIDALEEVARGYW